MKVSEFKGKTVATITTDGHIWFIRFNDGDTCMFSHKLKSLVPGHFDNKDEAIEAIVAHNDN